ncbi:LapD/MoxY N-terminal periplasmic domain-containing protein [Chitinivorax sp. B]|uniref:bifunctional diguanylate cyclase/phosphodiesterase n=1 Tax=Chitinivorax sp. B TaxID=2502235 RepID=UPI0010F9DE19|nr:LapD/MoxY N-terminal periplasmic domain-containing protein [Chitinivorax sp. B]
MTLLRRLWLTALGATFAAFVIGFVISMVNARSYLEQQLRAQSQDNATALALSMSQQSKDRATVELMVSALFDGGHFEVIRFQDAKGAVVIERSGGVHVTTVPSWFEAMFSITVLPGQAQVSDGWKQAGKVTVVAHSRFAYESLWKSAIWFVLTMSLVGVVTGLILTALFNWAKRPIEDLMEHAKAVAARQYKTMAEPSVPELRRVARAFNAMVRQVREMFAEQSARIEALQREASKDTLTDLPNRAFFLGRFRDQLADESAHPNGMLVVLRIVGLLQFNRDQGRDAVDQVLAGIADRLRQLAAVQPEWLCARLNGADFALLMPGVAHDMAEQTLQAWMQSVRQAMMTLATDTRGVVSAGMTFYQHGEIEREVLARVDHALVQGETSEQGWIAVLRATDAQAAPERDWLRVLTRAIGEAEFELATFPVLSMIGEELHEEALLRLPDAETGKVMTAGQFMPWVQRLGLSAEIDMAAATLACLQLRRDEGEISVNLLPATLGAEGWLARMQSLFEANRDVTPRLLFEVNEAGLALFGGALQAFTDMATRYQVRVGVEHFGRTFSSIPSLYELNLSFLKIDAGLIRDIDQQPSNQRLVKAIVGIAANAQCQVYAEGVHTAAEHAVLVTLGLNGYTGPEATRRLA